MTNEEKILEMLNGLTATVSELSKCQAAMRSDIAELKATQAKQGKQLDRLEEKAGELDARSLKSAVLLETDIPHQLGLLFEGHKTILETLSPKSRVEELEEEVTVLRSAFQALANRLTALEKAQ